MFSAPTIGLTAVLFAWVSQAQPFHCQITVPPNPLTAQGLATPYKMTGCNQIDFANQGSFVEAAILDPATGAIQIYNPLVINQNQATAGVDFIAPVVPTLPANAVVGIWFGSNANTITLTGSTNGCVNGLGGSVFGQFAYCNGPEWFTAAQTAISAGLLTVPPIGQATIATGQACPSVRDFRVIDMDQSDNVDTTYLLIDGKKLAQNTAANAAANKNATVLSNGSDNALINDFLAPTMGCTPFTASSITAPGGTSPALALNELQAQQFPPNPTALVPLNDDFAVINNNGAVTQSLAKTNLYRAGVGQTQAATTADASGTTYCQNYAASALFIAQNQALFSKATSPAPAVANNLFTFLANRFATSFGPVPSLGCSTIFGVNITQLVQQTTVKCIVTAAKINTTPFQQILNGQIKPGGTATSAAGAATGTATGAATGTSTKAGGGKGKAGNATATGTAATATSKAANAATGTSTAAAATGTGAGTGTKKHQNLRGLKARNMWARAS